LINPVEKWNYGKILLKGVISQPNPGLKFCVVSAMIGNKIE